MLKIYFAAPLFTQAERRWNIMVADCLRDRGFAVVLPQEAPAAAMDGPANARQIFQGNVAAIRDADIVLAVLDHADADSGTAWECGYAWAIGRPVVGVRTDFRAAGDQGAGPAVNLMLGQSCSAFAQVPPHRIDDLGLAIDRMVQALQMVQPTQA
jgi:nucleoside 2-deoxyribosyltransferase